MRKTLNSTAAGLALAGALFTSMTGETPEPDPVQIIGTPTAVHESNPVEPVVPTESSAPASPVIDTPNPVCDTLALDRSRLRVARLRAVIARLRAERGTR